MKNKPTLEEVKEHFKNSKLVRSALNKRVYSIDTEKYGVFIDDTYIRQKKDENCFEWLLWSEKEGYAEIISYKEDIIENGNLDKPNHYDNSKGMRFNEGKERWSLVDFESLKPMVKVLEFGAQKYDDHNWKKGLKTTEVAESLIRHLTAYLNGEDNDKETGLPHTGHILCNAMFLSYMHEFKKEFDTRYKKPCCGNLDELGNCKCE
jgi:hypothetical protein